MMSDDPVAVVVAVRVAGGAGVEVVMIKPKPLIEADAP